MSNGVPVCVIPGCSGFYPEICSDGAGGAVIAWDRNPTATDQNIYVHRVLANGNLAPDWPPKGTPATRAPGDQYLTDLVPDGTGGAFVVWYDWPNYDIYAQHVLGRGGAQSRLGDSRPRTTWGIKAESPYASPGRTAQHPFGRSRAPERRARRP
jgi:hypothetical protein